VAPTGILRIEAAERSARASRQPSLPTPSARFPHLQAGLREHAAVVAAVLHARHLAEVLQPVGVEPVVGDAVLVDVVDAAAAVLPVDRHAAEAGERVPQ
jgi:hypothetical protein